MAKAYLIIHLRATSKIAPQPQIVHVDIYSEPVGSITRLNSDILACVWEAEGNDFTEARENLISQVKQFKGHGWLLEMIP